MRFWWAIMAIIIIVVAGCDDVNINNPFEGDRPQAADAFIQEPPCEGDGDCAEHQECSYGSCHELDPCTHSVQCGYFRRCKDNFCREQKNCEHTADCDAELICSAGHCQIPCQGHEQCEEGYVCKSGPGAAAPSYCQPGCQGHEECPVDQYRCRIRPSDTVGACEPRCAMDQECGGTRPVCHPELQYCVECVQDNMCLERQACVRGDCTRSCLDNETCDRIFPNSGGLCRIREGEDSGICQQRCNDHESCNDGISSRWCNPQPGICEPGCYQDSQCDRNLAEPDQQMLFCAREQGSCEPGCYASAQCEIRWQHVASFRRQFPEGPLVCDLETRTCVHVPQQDGGAPDQGVAADAGMPRPDAGN